MRVKVLYFASLRERAGAPSGEEDLAAGTTVSRLWEMIRARPSFTGVGARPGFAVNGEWVAADRVLAHGDEVALLPPVSGGGGS
jgi:molybdopterin converting factor subunit 1